MKHEDRWYAVCLDGDGCPGLETGTVYRVIGFGIMPGGFEVAILEGHRCPYLAKRFKLLSKQRIASLRRFLESAE